MSIGEKMKTIAERIPSVYGKGQAVGYTQGHQAGYQEGVVEGGNSAREYCLLNHYVDSVLGNDEKYLEVNIPFQPDVVMVYSTNPCSDQYPDTYKAILYDSRACGRFGSYLHYCGSSGQHTSGAVGSERMNQFFTYQNGVWRFSMGEDSSMEMRWRKNVRYTIIAVRYAYEHVEQLVREQIFLLPDNPPSESSGTLMYSKFAIDRYFTEDQWQKLTATKPNWNFVLK